jgi:hypothetical protein
MSEETIELYEQTKKIAKKEDRPFISVVADILNMYSNESEVEE